jgi:hypothetical protein
MDTPSPDSAPDLMTHLNQGCEVGHTALLPVWGMRLHHPFSDGDLLLTNTYCAQSCQVLRLIDGLFGVIEATKPLQLQGL